MSERPLPSRGATIAIVAICLLLPMNLGCGLLARAMNTGGPDSPGVGNPLLLAWFFTYLPILLLAMWIVEPLAGILAVVWTLRGPRGEGSGTRLMVCWIAFALHTLALVWLLTRPGMRR